MNTLKKSMNILLCFGAEDFGRYTINTPTASKAKEQQQQDIMEKKEAQFLKNIAEIEEDIRRENELLFNMAKEAILGE